MPRPKVRPEDRRRSYRACLPCKTLKIRCDALQPCGSCLRRGQASHCTYSGIDRRRRNYRQESDLCESDVSEDVLQGEGNMRGSLPSPFSMEIPVERQDETTLSAGSGREKGMRLIYSRNNTLTPLGWVVYVGETSSQSFLHFLRKTVRAYAGSVSFTDGERQYVTLDADLSIIGSGIRLDTSQAKLYSLIDAYLEATSGILELFTAGEFDYLIRERMSDQEGSSSQSIVKDGNQTALDLALAIGAQARGLAQDQPLCKAYFARARAVALENMFVSQSLESIRIFLLVAFYMLGACNRSGAAMFLGVASKGALMLGLPGAFTDKCNSKELQIWHSIQNINVLSSFILGRPNELPREDGSFTDTHNPQSPFKAMVKVCSILEDIVDAQRRSTGLLHVPLAETQLQSLRHWSRALPSHLRTFIAQSTLERGSSDLRPLDRQSLMGSMHLSCAYYFAVILITRPFLVAYLMSRLRGRAPDHLISDPDQASDINIKNNKVSRLAQVCVSSASYMVDMCVKAKGAGFTFGNMCLLKAWVFAAGLVLGFSMFAGEPRHDINESFGSACTVLAEIALTSPQAQLYHDILTSFAEAVDAYRQRVENERRLTVQHYMDQVLVIDTAPVVSREESCQSTLTENERESNGRSLGSSETVIGAAANADDELRALLQLTEFRTQGYGHGQDHTPAGWNDVDMQLLEYPVPEIEPFDQFFYTVE
ncbi:hypothetical protein BJY04DRAFT_229014 [Aspergillus karnatakaensis]|uniref:uncharacterized protein n=1 Tax=Aspergillus karnatakaensis TaxID=1810916 RepID=UPI003CCE0604